MKKMIFTVEETNLMSCFDTSSRETLISDVENGMLDADDEELWGMLRCALQKLKQITDEEFGELYIASDSLSE